MKAFATAAGLLIAMFCTASATAATYVVSSAAPYTAVQNFVPPCPAGTGPCANFSTSMGVSGTFDTPTLAPNLVNANLVGSLTAFSLSDGVTSYSLTDPDVRNVQFQVSTNAGGQITSANITLQRWLTGTAPHTTADYWSLLQVTGSSVTQVFNNSRCGVLNPSPLDFCNNKSGVVVNQESIANGGSVAFAAAVAPVAAAVAVPTLQTWAVLLLSLVLGATAWMRRTKR